MDKGLSKYTYMRGMRCRPQHHLVDLHRDCQICRDEDHEGGGGVVWGWEQGALAAMEGALHLSHPFLQGGDAVVCAARDTIDEWLGSVPSRIHQHEPRVTE